MYMLYEKSVIDAILKVVTDHECAVIADFGGFIVRRNPGLFNSFSGELKASTAIVYFNNEIKSDDGLVADALRSITGESFKTCQQIIWDWVKHINNELSLKKSYSLLPLGNFHTNTSGGVFFVSSPNFSIDPYSFGLPVFQWKWDLFTESSASEIKPSNEDDLNFSSQRVVNGDEDLHTTIAQISSESSNRLDSVSSLSTISSSSSNTSEINVNTSEVVENLLDNDEFRIDEIIGVTINDDKEAINQQHSPSTEEEIAKPSILWQIAAAIAIISISVSLYFTFSQLLEARKEKSAEQASMIVGLNTDVEEEEIVFVKEDKPTYKAHTLKYSFGTSGIDSMEMELHKRNGKYFVTGGAYITEKLALAEGLRWQKLGYDVCLLSAKNSSLTKVVLGRFNSEKMASLFVENISEMPTGTISVEELTFNW